MKHLFWLVPFVSAGMFFVGRAAYLRSGDTFWMSMMVAGGVLFFLYVLVCALSLLSGRKRQQ